jgi:hypothetical protein
MEVLYVSNDNLLVVDELYDAVAASYLNAATVTVTVKAADGTNVAGTGITWPVTLSYVATSNGKYRCVLEDAMTLSAGRRYTACITADGGSNKKAYWEVPLRALTRTE